MRSGSAGAEGTGGRELGGGAGIWMISCELSQWRLAKNRSAVNRWPVCSCSAPRSYDPSCSTESNSAVLTT